MCCNKLNVPWASYGTSSKETGHYCRRDTRDKGSSLGLKDPLGQEWQSAPVLLPGKFHGQRGPVASGS